MLIHAEAFALMQYASDDGRITETIWNSRDGVTPFVVFSADGVEMSHVRWNQDQFAPLYVPAIGERVFVNMTIQRALEFADRQMAAWAEHDLLDGYLEGYPSRTEARLALALDTFGDGNQPDLVTVDEKLHEQFKTVSERRRELLPRFVAPLRRFA